MVERIFASVALMAMAIVGAVLGYWWFIDGAGPVVTVEWSKTDKLVYAQGDTMHISRKMCLLAVTPYAVHRAFVDHIVYQLTDYVTQVRDTGCSVRAINIEIPDALPPGRYIYRVWADFRINPIKTVRFDYPDLPTIEVVEKVPGEKG